MPLFPPEDPLTLSEAEHLLQEVTSEDFRTLASSSDEADQFVARMALAFLGEDDLSWSAAQTLLQKGNAAVQEILSVEGAAYLTRRTLLRMEELGTMHVERFCLASGHNIVNV